MNRLYLKQYLLGTFKIPSEKNLGEKVIEGVLISKELLSVQKTANLKKLRNKLGALVTFLQYWTILHNGDENNFFNVDKESNRNS